MAAIWPPGHPATRVTPTHATISISFQRFDTVSPSPFKAPAQLAILYNESPPSYLAGEQIEQQGSNTNDLVLQMDDRLLLPPALATLVIEQPCQCTVGGRGVSAVIEHSTRNTSRPTHESGVGPGHPEGEATKLPPSIALPHPTIWSTRRSALFVRKMVWKAKAICSLSTLN